MNEEVLITTNESLNEVQEKGENKLDDVKISQLNKNELRFTIRKIMRNLLLYEFIFMGGVMLIALFGIILTMVAKVIPVSNGISSILRELDGIGYLVFGTIAVFFYYKRQQLSLKPVVVSKNKSMTLEWCVIFILLFLGSQFLFTQLATIVEWILNQVGFSMQLLIDSATTVDSSASMMFYASLAGPIFEELLFRGGIAMRLQSYGKVLAIFLSALLFGLFHMNFIQGIFAFVIGLVFAFIAIEFGWIWSLAFHVFNNYVLAEVVPNGLTVLFGDAWAEVAMSSLLVIGFVVSLLILWLYRKEIHTYYQKNRSIKGTYPIVFKTGSLWVFIILCLLFSFFGISRL